MAPAFTQDYLREVEQELGKLWMRLSYSLAMTSISNSASFRSRDTFSAIHLPAPVTGYVRE